MMSIEEIFEGLDEFESLNQSTTDNVLQVEQELHDTITRLRSLVEATETDLFEQKKKRRRLEKENENLSISIQGVTGAKANLDKSYQELEGLYGRLEQANAALVKKWEDLGEALKTHRSNICLSWNIDDTIDLMKKLQEGR